MNLEIYKRGIGIAAQYLQNQGFEILDVNDDPDSSPQILAKRNGQMTMIMVAVDELPKIGEMNQPLARGFANFAIQKGALSYFLGIGLEDLGAQTRVKTADLQLVTVEVPLPPEDKYVEQYPTRVRLDRVPNFPKLPMTKIIWRTSGTSVVDGGDWRLNQWQGIFNSHVTPDNFAKIMIIDERANPEIIKHWQNKGLPNPVFEVPVKEVWLDDNEIYKIAPQITPDEIRNLNLLNSPSSVSSASSISSLLPELPESPISTPSDSLSAPLPPSTTSASQPSTTETSQKTSEKKPWWKVW